MRAEDLARRLHGVSRSGDDWSGCCPAHDDARPSLSFRDGDGALLVRCHAGCAVADIATALDVPVSDLLSTKRGRGGDIGHRPSRIVATYDYVDERGTLLYQAVRLGPKGNAG